MRPRIILSVLFVAIIALTFTRIAVANRLSTNGAVLGGLEEQINFYETENALIKEKIFNLSSLNNISSKAARLGFVEDKKGFVINSEVPVAIR